MGVGLVEGYCFGVVEGADLAVRGGDGVVWGRGVRRGRGRGGHGAVWFGRGWRGKRRGKMMMMMFAMVDLYWHGN